MSAARIRVLVVDDHRLVREGIVTLLRASPAIEVVGEAADGGAAMEEVRRLRPDVTLMDLSMPAGPVSGVGAIATFRREVPEARFLVLTTYDGDEDIRRAMNAGARGYLLKDVSRATLLEAIQAVHRGETFVPPDVAGRLAWRDPASDLSARELEVLRLVAKGQTNRAIARALSISENTVEKHVHQVMTKLDVSTRAQAILAAIQRGLVASNR